MSSQGLLRVASVPVVALLLAVVGAAGPVAAGAAPRPLATLPCAAHMSTATPARYTTVTVFVATKARAHVTTVAHYKTTSHAKSTTANAAGRAAIPYAISSATRGYRVVVGVVVSLRGVVGRCSTAFTPH
jgi:hypothetical protein